MLRWPLLVLALFLIVALFGLPPLLPAWLHVVLLVAFFAALAVAGLRAWRSFRPAGRTAALARLETDSGLAHAPLQSLEDELATGGDDPFTRALWLRHRDQLAGMAQAVRLRAPRSELPRLDPWAFRVGVALVLLVALVDAQGRVGDRLHQALLPGIARAEERQAVTAELWVEPPAYTRQPPRQVPAGAQRVLVPKGSQALLQIHHLPAEGELPPVAFGATPVTPKRLGEASAEARFEITMDGDLEVGGKERIATFPLAAQPDRAPTIAADGEPKITVRGAVELGWSGSDDYGLVSTAVEIEPSQGGRPPERLPLKSLPDQPREAKGKAYLDLLPHPLAGTEVRLTLIAVDALGQEGRAAPVTLTLPERQFENPLAKAIIEQRKDLAASPDDRAEIADLLDQLGQTGMAESMPPSVPLSLGSAAERLRRPDLSDEDLRSVMDQLWDTALAIEDGRMATAERDLRRIQEQLEKALAENADNAEIERLMEELQQAMDAYLDELTKQALAEAMRDPQALQRMQRQQPMPNGQNQMVERSDLQKMLDRAKEMMKSGSRQGAEEMLAQLREMMENLQAQVPGQAQQGPAPGEEALSELQEAIRRQQMLQDQAFKMDQQMAQQGQDGQQGQQQMTPEQLGQLQQLLRRQLGQIMQGLAEQGMKIPDQLGQAELQMRGAEGQLNQGSPGAATDPQGQAMALMQQAGRGIMDQMRQQMGQGQGQGQPGGPGGQGQQQGRNQTGMNRDPLGRAPEGMGSADSDSTVVPDEADLGRARAVLEELYRRSADPDRPRSELDYYDRLLERF